MASDPEGSTKNLTDSRAEALQALVSSLAPGGADSLSKEDVTKLSEKLKELLGDADLPQGGVKSNERGESLNEEGLPIIEITEPMENTSQPAASAPADPAPIVDADATEDTSFVPMYRLPPAERARNQAQMHRILDLLEEEERVEEERTEARDRHQRRAELEQRRANAKAELERLKALKDMQKKMGKALLRNMADAREKEEQASAEQVKADLELEEESRRARKKPRKCVSWAEEMPKSDSSRIPLRPDVVERFPTRPIASPSPPPPDSDDESNPPEPDSDELHSDRAHSPSPEPPLSDDDDTGGEDEPAEEGDHASDNDDDEFDMDAVQHQREIALAYFEQRNKIGADAARAMSAHSHEPNDEWDQEDVPLDATLAGPPSKPPQSKFKSSRLARTLVPSTTPSTSLGTSILPSTSSSSALRSALRTGKLEDEQLVSIDSDSGDDDDDDEGDARAFMDALRRGDVTNAGAASNADVLVAALESAYGAPPPTTTTPIPAPAPAPARQQQKDSKFKPVRAAAPPRILAANAEGPREGTAVASLPLPMNETVLERKPQPQLPQAQAQAQAPMAIIDSPSFPPPPAVIDSPSAQRRPTRPPTVIPASGGRGRGAAEVLPVAPISRPASGPGKKISRFKAQQQQD